MSNPSGTQGASGIPLDAATNGDQRPYDRPDMGRAAATGARSFALSRIVIEAMLLLSVVGIARLVSPAQQGQAAVALVFPVIASILTFEGFGSALVQSRRPVLIDYRTAMSMSLICGMASTLIAIGAADTAGSSILGAQVAHLIVLASPTFLIASTTCVSRAQMMRDLAFSRMSRNDVLATVASTASVIGLAAIGLGARALVYGALILSVVDMLLQFSYVLPPRPGWSRDAARRIFGFGSYASLTGVLSTLLNNVDYLILGAFFPARLVGIYYRSFAFGVQYQGKLTYVLMRMAFPLMSRAKDNAEMRRVRERVVEFNAMTALPFLGLLIVLAPTAVPLLYGHRWHAAIVPTQILAVAGIATALNAGSLGPALALGRTRRLAAYMASSLLFYSIAIAAAAPFGLITVCISAATAHCLIMLACQRYLIDKVIGLPAKQIVLDAGPATIATVVAMGATAGVNHLLLAIVPSVISAVICTGFGLSLYVLAMRVLFPERARRFINMAMRVLRSRRQVATA